ncbi:protein of unknown function [Dysgonomonas macrotermitis]|uniref:DUF4294 domain-containing protein n=2 Tax=Dysgonomonas macrotermitis TaxID=1346286 RepID=A0A1M4YT67_9BACT|nr:protein of unknown function [Dysgonomonas macrotermitis]
MPASKNGNESALMKKYYILFVLFLLGGCLAWGQGSKRVIYYTATFVDGDTIYNAYLPETIVFGPLKFKNDKERQEYTKLVRDVKKALPYANLVSQNIIETYEMMETLPDKKAKQKHLEQAQKYIMAEYKPKMKKLTKNQGKILVKLIDRQTNSSTYDIVKSLVGPLRATIYNTFAGIFGNNLKTEYDPEGKDKMIERIVVEIEQGKL